MANCVKCGNDLPDCQCSCKNCENIVFNAVLAYCQFSLENYSVVEVSKAVEQFFCNEEVAAARDMLRQLFLGRLDDLEIKKIVSRKSSPNRTCLEANASDVTEAVYHLINSVSPPRFATFDLKKLPILTAALATTRAQSEAVLLLEKKMQQVEQRLVDYGNILKQQDDKISECVAHRNDQVKARSDGAVINVNKSRNPVQEGQHLSLPPPMPGFGASGRQQQPSVPSWATVTATSQISESASDTADNNQPWQIPRRERLRMQAHQKQAKGEAAGQQQTNNNRRKHTACIHGSADNTQVKAGIGPNRDLWIFNVHKDMNDADLRNFIAEGGSTKENKVNIRLFEARYKKDAESKQFRLTIGLKDYEYVYKAEFWPLDVSVRKYWISNNERSNKQHDKSNEATNGSG